MTVDPAQVAIGRGATAKNANAVAIGPEVSAIAESSEVEPPGRDERRHVHDGR
ncbi:hypothetical protein [Andreprevotia chitinilytica]|uniref:hypothetical protein n=1 Tax=Andreprevotia chitinilytica TaxID=396808 RepID=UPI000A0076FD|nr:hypothetical protein [Andreprevotia chitinilytica]